jgi:hypothetical protein
MPPASDAGHGDTPFPRLETMEQQQELLRTYNQQCSSPATTDPSQQHAGNATVAADANVGATTGETANEVGGEEVDELRRSEMVFEAEKARCEARKHLGDV